MGEITEFQKWFYRFTEKNNVPYKSWNVTCNDKVYFIDTYTVEDCILSNPAKIQEHIKDLMIKINESNGDINDYFYLIGISIVKRLAQQEQKK